MRPNAAVEVLDDHEVITPSSSSFTNGWPPTCAQWVRCSTRRYSIKRSQIISESIIQLHPSFHLDESDFDFSEKERMLLAHEAAAPMTYADAAKLTDAKSVTAY